MLRKKIILSLCVLAFVIGMHTVIYGATGTVTTEGLKMRETADLNAKVLTVIYQDDKIEVLEKQEEWYKIKYDGKTGYVSSKYVKVDEEDTNTTKKEEEQKEEETPVEKEETTPVSGTPEVVVPSEQTIENEVEIKILPLIQSSTIATLGKNTKVMITQNLNGWIYINTEQVSGWIRIEKLTKADNTVPTSNDVVDEKETPVEEETAVNEKKYVSAEVVNVRKENNTSSEVLANLAKNVEVTVIATKGEWSKVKTNGKEGYILSKYLSDKKVEVTNRSLETQRQEKEEPKKEEPVVSQEDPTNDTTSSTSQSDVVAYAKKFLGVPYKLGGTSPSAFDCSGFTSYVYKHFGYSIARTATAQASNGASVSRSNLQLGDLVIFRDGANAKIGHVGIFIGNNQFIHASSPGDVVKITSLSMSYYNTRYVTARRILK